MTRPIVPLVLALILVIDPTSSLAQVTDDPSFDDRDNSFGGGVGEEATDGPDSTDSTDNGDAGGSGSGTGDDSDPYPYEERVLIDDNLGGPGCPDGEVRQGTYEVRLITGPGPDDWEHLRYEYDCSGDDRPAADTGSVEAAPVAPSSANDERAAAAIREYLPSPVPGLSPDQFGVTGLATWFWFEHDDLPAIQSVDHDGDPTTPPVPGMTASATDDDWTITATVWIDEYRWELDDGTILRSEHPGTEQAPAAIHTWITKDPDNRVRIVASWAGTYSWSSPSDSGSGSMGTLDIATDHDYPVFEIRAVPAD